MIDMWLLYALLAAVLWGFDYAFAERVIKYVPISVFLSLQLFFASIIVAIFSWINGSWGENIISAFSHRQTLILFILGILSFASANLLIVNAIQNRNATLSALIEISYPVFIALVSWLIFKENQLTLSAMVGGVLIFGGIFIIYHFNQ